MKRFFIAIALLMPILSAQPGTQAQKDAVKNDLYSFFDVLFRRAEASCGAKEHVTAVSWCCSEKLRKAGIHHDRLLERSAATGMVVLVDAEAFLRALA